MSRKREAQREDKKELARQMGVRGREVPQKLIEHERVTEPRLGTSVVVEHWPSGLLHKLPGLKPKPRALHIDAALWCVSRGEARLVRSLAADVSVAGAGAVNAADVKASASDHGHDVVRYKRPGSFVLMVVAADADAPRISASTLQSVQLDGADTPIVDLAKQLELRPVSLAQGPSPGTMWGAAVVARGAADRLRETVRFPFFSPDGAVGIAVDVDLRL